MLFLIMLEILYVNALLNADKDITISLFKENNKPTLIIKHDGKILKNQKIFDFFHQLSKNEKNSMDMYLVQKIINLFEYDLVIKDTKEENIISIKLNTLPPKKLLN
jgi:hypothetical protein